MYEDGTSFCFSCRAFFPKTDKPEKATVKEDKQVSRLTLAEIAELPVRGFKERAIPKVVTEFYKVHVSYDEDGAIDTHYYPYDGGNAYKVRKLPKDFSWIKNSQKLFGQELFNAGGRRLVITEGEIDAMSVSQASYAKYKKFYPVVALPSSTMTKALLANRDWIRSFKEVVLCFDSDDAGKKATEAAVKIIGADRVKITKLPEKDANDTLVKHGDSALLSAIFEASPYIPSGIITKEMLWESLVNYNDVPTLPYPPCLAGVNSKVKGMRPGEIALFISGTGSGKSTVLREVMLHILETTSEKIGIISLEESPAETARKLSGMVLGKNPAKEEIPIEELKTGFDKVFGEDRAILLDHQGSMSDISIVDQLEYMCLSGCSYLFIDHITILVSEGVDKLTGNEAQDRVMNDLLRIVKRYPVWIGLVSHLRKAPNGGKSFEEGKLPAIDDIRGSGSIKQISFDIISFARNLTADNDAERNLIKMRVLKSRYTGLTGTVQGASYDYDTGRLKASDMVVEDFEIL
jgi:twinkle protein